jgi:hypothetical protein
MILRAMLAVAYATGRASHSRQVKGDGPDKKGKPGPSGWVLGVRLTTPPHKKILLRDLKRRPSPTQDYRADDDDDESLNRLYISSGINLLQVKRYLKKHLKTRFVKPT